MTKSKINKELDKEIFSTMRTGRYFIINLTSFPEWDTLLIRLAFLYRKYNIYGVGK